MGWALRRAGDMSHDFGSVRLIRSLYSSVTQEDWVSLEALIQSAIKEKQRFERVVVTKENLLEMFKVSLPRTSPASGLR